MAPESIISSNQASEIGAIKKIRSPQASTVKHLLQTTSKFIGKCVGEYMSAEKEREPRVNKRGNPSLLHWNDKPSQSFHREK